MTFVKFDGFIQNNNVKKEKFSLPVAKLVRDTIVDITKRYKSSDPNFPAHSYVHKLKFSKNIDDIFINWKTDFDGELQTTDYGVAEHLINDSKKSYGGYGISQTFNYKDDSFQVYVNFRKIRLG